MVVLFGDFKEPSYSSPPWLYQSTFLQAEQECSLFFTLSPASTLHRYFDDGHSDQLEVVRHCGFDLHLSNN